MLVNCSDAHISHFHTLEACRHIPEGRILYEGLSVKHVFLIALQQDSYWFTRIPTETVQPGAPICVRKG